MTTYSAIAGTDIDADSPITVALMTALRDNPIAIAEKAAGAPPVLATTVTPASQATMETATNNDTAVTPLAVNWHPGAAKAWGYVTMSGGTPTLQASWNITSITDGGVGILSITIATDFSSTNYCCNATVKDPSGTVHLSCMENSTSRTAGVVSLECKDSSAGLPLTDPLAWSFSMFGDQ